LLPNRLPVPEAKEVAMKSTIPRVEYHFMHDEVNMNYQLNRPLSFGSGNLEEIRSAARRIGNLVDWKREFLLLADKAER